MSRWVVTEDCTLNSLVTKPALGPDPNINFSNNLYLRYQTGISEMLGILHHYHYSLLSMKTHVALRLDLELQMKHRACLYRHAVIVTTVYVM